MDWEFLIDKVVIALLLLAVSFGFNYHLEKSKANSAFRNELEKQRVVRIGKTWTAVYESEGVSDQLMRELAEVILKYPHDAETRNEQLRKLSPLQQESMEKANFVRKTAYSNRFWLGKTEYAKVLKFYNCQMDRLTAFGKGDLTTFKKLKRKLDAAKMSISDYLDNPFPYRGIRVSKRCQ